MFASSPSFHENSYDPRFVCGLSALLEPAYVESSSLKEYLGADDFFENRLIPDEPEKVVFDPQYSASPFDQPYDAFCNRGNILKASAAVHLSDFASAHPYGEYMQSASAIQSQQKDCRKRRTKRRAVLLIATQLNELQSEDPDKILIVRKINRLGFDSADILTEHFEQFGVVDKVRLSNAHNKERGSHNFQVRLRPSGIGFVVFESSEAATKALAEGETRIIQGVEVHVRAFERRRFDSSASAFDEDEMLKEDAEETSSLETASTRCSTIGSAIELEEE